MFGPEKLRPSAVGRSRSRSRSRRIKNVKQMFLPAIIQTKLVNFILDSSLYAQFDIILILGDNTIIIHIKNKEKWQLCNEKTQEKLHFSLHFRLKKKTKTTTNKTYGCRNEWPQPSA